MTSDTVKIVVAALASEPNIAVPFGSAHVDISRYEMPAQREIPSEFRNCVLVESVNSSTESVIRRFTEPPETWDADLQRRFEKLLTKRIKRQLTETDAFEYEQLKQWRRDLLSPRSIEELLREREEIRVSNDLIKALRQYVQFVGPTH